MTSQGSQVLVVEFPYFPGMQTATQFREVSMKKLAKHFVHTVVEHSSQLGKKALHRMHFPNGTDL